MPAPSVLPIKKAQGKRSQTSVWDFCLYFIVTSSHYYLTFLLSKVSITCFEMNYRLSTKKVTTVFKVSSKSKPLTQIGEVQLIWKANLVCTVASEKDFKFYCIWQHPRNKTCIWIYALTFIIWVHLYTCVTVNVKPIKRYHPNKFRQTQVTKIRGWWHRNMI